MPAAEAPPTPSDPSHPTERHGSPREIQALDVAVYAAIASTPTPTLDRAFAAVSRAADHAKLWTATAAVLAVTGGRQGRRAAVDGLASVAVTSTVVNVGIKPLRRRRRPDRVAYAVPIARHVEMPLSTSFPSGHAASAFAFATGVTRELPTVGIPLHAAAAVVAYSRVHAGVHYPIDVIAGSVFGGSLSPVATTALDRWRVRRACTPRAMTTRAVTHTQPSATTRPVSDLLRVARGPGARGRQRVPRHRGVLGRLRPPRATGGARGRGSRGAGRAAPHGRSRARHLDRAGRHQRDRHPHRCRGAAARARPARRRPARLAGVPHRLCGRDVPVGRVR